jgi:iron complex outermembrane recepter protein
MPQRQILFSRRGRGMRWTLLGTCAFAALAIALPANAASAADDVDPFSLSPEQLFDATVMSVSKTNEKVGNSPAAVYVLTNEDILRSGATSIPEALRLVPGIQVARSNNSSWAISVRGLNSGLANKLLVLIDGREVYDALFSGVYWDIQDTPLADIERIEIIRGPGASLWGANAVNGVVNIITKPAAQTQGALVTVAAGNEERAILTGRFGAAADAAHWRVYAKYFDRDSQRTPQGADAHDDWRALRAGFRTDWDEDVGGNSFTLQGDVYSSESGKRSAVPQLTPPYTITAQNDISAQGANVLARWNRALGDNSSFSVQAYLDFVARDQLTLQNGRDVFDIEAQYDLPTVDAHELVVGAHYRYSREELTASPTISFTTSTRNDQLISGFVQDKITLDADRWFLTVGSKFEHNDYSGFEVQPSARLQWQGDGQMAWGALSRAVRTPSMFEHNLNILAGVIPPGPFPVSYELVPSPSFQSEELIAYELGYRRQLTPSLLMDVSAFFNDYDKLATFTFAPGFIDAGPPLHFVVPIVTTNATQGETYGFELVMNWRAQDNLNFSASYSLVEIQLHSPSGTLGGDVAEDQSPEQQFNLRAQWDVSDEFAFDTTLYYVDALPAYDIDAYLRLDARFGWHVADGFELELVGQNLLDDSHREFGSVGSVSSTEIQRSIFARLSWRS